MNHRSRTQQIFATAVLVTVADQLTKAVAGALRTGAILPVHNPDYSLGLVSGATPVLVLGSLVGLLDRKGQIAWETAPFAVGQHKGLAGPGQNGNMVLSGHISSPGEGAIFHHLPDLNVATPDFFKGLEPLLKEESLDRWKTYLRAHLILASASRLATWRTTQRSSCGIILKCSNTGRNSPGGSNARSSSRRRTSTSAIG